ncbi:MAG: DUF1194 domain-containing protein [Proteobacteria bacterium]|nr:DUF1194 domain-containing protein [Pseudomonadota bacterium]
MRFLRALLMVVALVSPALVFLALVSPALVSPARAELVDLELVLAIDISGSVDAQEAELQRAGYVAALTDPTVLRAIKSGRHGRIALTYMEWAGDHVRNTLVDWTVIDGAAAAKAFARRLAGIPLSIEMWTSISGAIDYGLDLFHSSPHKGKRRVLDISGDGPNNDGGAVNVARDRAVKAGIVINGLPIINDRPSRFGGLPMPHLDNYYRDCVIGGFGSFIVVADTFKDFARAIRRKMILEIAGGMARPMPKSGPGPDREARLIAAQSPAATDLHPPCNIGEVLRDSRDSF